MDLEPTFKVRLLVDPSVDWAYSGAVGADQYDFVSYAARELAFAAGLGTDLWLEAPIATNPDDGSIAFGSYIPNSFDQHIVDARGEPIALSGTGRSDLLRKPFGVSSDVQSSNLFLRRNRGRGG